MKLRNISGEARWVPLLQRVVEPDELIDVPELEKVETGEFTEKGAPATRTPAVDEVWPESLWTQVADAPTRKTTAKSEE